MTEPTRARLILWLCASGSAELRTSYCHELRARLVQRCLDTRVIALDDEVRGLPTAGCPGVTCTLVLAGRGSRLDREFLAAGQATVFRACFHSGTCHGDLHLLPEVETVAGAVDRTLAVLEQTGMLAAQTEDVRHDEELMVRRLYDLGYL